MSYGINIDFHIVSSLYWLNVWDLSQWGNIDELPSIIEITLPGTEEPLTTYYQKSKVNSFNSNTMLLACNPSCDPAEKTHLADGLYHIKVIGSPSSHYKESYFLKDDVFQLNLDKLYLEYVDNFTETTIDNLTEVEFIRNSAHAAVRLGLFKKAMTLFSRAQKKLDKIKTCITCK